MIKVITVFFTSFQPEKLTRKNVAIINATFFPNRNDNDDHAAKEPAAVN